MERRSTLHHVSVGEEVQRPTDGAWSAVQSIVGPDAEGLYAVTFADGEKMRFTSSVVVLVRPHLAATPAPLPALAPPPPAPVPSPPRAPTPSPDLSWRGQVVKLATTYIVEQNDAALRLMDTQRDLALRATLHNTESVRQAAIRDAETAARIAKTVRAAADQPRPAAARRRAERDLGRMRCMSCGSESDDDKLRPCPRCGANQWALSDFEPPVARLAAARSAPRPQPAPRPARATGTSSRAVPGTSSGAVPAAREPVARRVSWSARWGRCSGTSRTMITGKRRR